MQISVSGGRVVGCTVPCYSPKPKKPDEQKECLQKPILPAPDVLNRVKEDQYLIFAFMETVPILVLFIVPQWLTLQIQFQGSGVSGRDLGLYCTWSFAIDCQT